MTASVLDFGDTYARIKANFIGEHIRLDEGSLKMKQAFGYKGAQKTKPNLISIAARQMGTYLARKINDDGNTTLVYWATGADGAGVEVVGDLPAYEVEKYAFEGPKEFGAGVKLLPAVRYFVERFASACWGLYAFFTQGAINDLEEVKKYTLELAREIAAGCRNGFKLVLVGVGKKISQTPLQLLANLDQEAPVDLWNYRIVAEMQNILEIFTELGDANTIIAPTGKVLAPTGQSTGRFFSHRCTSSDHLHIASRSQAFQSRAARGNDYPIGPLAVPGIIFSSGELHGHIKHTNQTSLI